MDGKYFSSSLNIPRPSREAYLKAMVVKLESFIKQLRSKVFSLKSPNFMPKTNRHSVLTAKELLHSIINLYYLKTIFTN